MTRCAPVRDEALRDVEALLQDESRETLPKRLISAIKQLLSIMELMKSDLTSTLLDAASDDLLEAEVVRVAREKEITYITKAFGLQFTCQTWRTWVEEEEGHTWARRLVRSLGKDVAVSCPRPSEREKEKNAIPPPFYFSLHDLFRLQNLLQAIVIAAVLRTLVPLSPIAKDTDATDQRFTNRVLALLILEVNDITNTPLKTSDTKLINLADEVIREHQRLQTEGGNNNTRPETELSLRAKVDVLIQPTNAVFILLRRRIVDHFSERIERLLREEYEERRLRIPGAMHTGREQKRARGPDHIIVPSSSTPFIGEKGSLRRLAKGERAECALNGLHVKGFDDPALREAAGSAFDDLCDIVEWVHTTWAGLGLQGLDASEGANDGGEARKVKFTSDVR
jgi:hypothetical protein